MKNFDPAEIAAIYCRGHRNPPVSRGHSGKSQWTHGALIRLRQAFGGEDNRLSLSSAEFCLAHMGYTQDTIRDFTRIVEDTIGKYKTAIADDMGRWPEFTFDRRFFLGMHVDGKALSDHRLLEELESGIRRGLTVYKLEISPVFDNWQPLLTIGG